MNAAIAFLTAHWDRLGLHQFGAPTDFQSVLLTPRFQTSAHVISLIIAKKTGEPVLVTKAARNGGPDGALAREAANLRLVHAARPGGFDSIPRLIAHEEYRGTPLLLETAVAGRILKPSLVRQRPRQYAQAILDWITPLHVATAQRNGRAAHMSGHWSELMHQLANDHPLTDSDAQLVVRTRELIAPLTRASLPLVFEHGDLSAPNILIADTGALNVVDWELANPEGLPAHDLFFSLAFVAFSRAGATTESQYVEAFADAFFGAGAWARPYVERYAESLRLDRDLLPALFVACWSTYVARRAERLAAASVNSGTPADRWARLKRNHYFALWSYAVTHIRDFSSAPTDAARAARHGSRTVSQTERRGWGPSIAVVGPDGAGKTTITRMLEGSRVLRLKYLYMGINTSSSNIALPTSRLIERLKRKPGSSSSPRSLHSTSGTESSPTKRRGILWVTARLLNRLAEQWFRQSVAWYYQLRGYVVLYDRHFVFDFGGTPLGQTLPLDKRIYQWCVARFSPRPDLVILLDAPGEVLFARKGESTIGELEDRRQRLLRQGKQLRAFIIVDATRPLSVVYDEVTQHILAFCNDPSGHVARVRTGTERTIPRSSPVSRGPALVASVAEGSTDG